MTAKQARFLREVYCFNGLTPGPFLVDGPRRGKLATEMAAAGWLQDHGPVGSIGNAYRVTQAGIDAYNAAIAKAQSPNQGGGQ